MPHCTSVGPEDFHGGALISDSGRLESRETSPGKTPALSVWCVSVGHRAGWPRLSSEAPVIAATPGRQHKHTHCLGFWTGVGLVFRSLYV